MRPAAYTVSSCITSGARLALTSSTPTIGLRTLRKTSNGGFIFIHQCLDAFVAWRAYCHKVANRLLPSTCTCTNALHQFKPARKPGSHRYANTASVMDVSIGGT
jgi:hypothetical protein